MKIITLMFTRQYPLSLPSQRWCLAPHIHHQCSPLLLISWRTQSLLSYLHKHSWSNQAKLDHTHRKELQHHCALHRPLCSQHRLLLFYRWQLHWPLLYHHPQTVFWPILEVLCHWISHLQLNVYVKLKFTTTTPTSWINIWNSIFEIEDRAFLHNSPVRKCRFLMDLGKSCI